VNLTQQQFHRFINRVGSFLEWVPADREPELMEMLRVAYHPGRTPSGQVANQLNRLYNYLGPHKTAYLHRLADQAHVTLDDTMTKRDADRLWEHLNRLYEEWGEEDIPL
jgi:hypothetical protein